MKNEWTKRIEELEAENTRLRMYRDAAESRAQGLEVERDAAVKWLEEYKSKTYCAYCGAIFNIDSDASHVSEHIRTCPHHPMRELEAENKRLRVSLVNFFKAAEFENVEEMVSTKSPEFYLQLGKVVAERGKELKAEVAKLTTALKDKPDQSDLDAAVFRINHLEAAQEGVEVEDARNKISLDPY